MSYCDYKELFVLTQRKRCPYRALMFDVVDSRNQSQYLNDPVNHFACILHFYDVLMKEEKRTNTKILLNGKNNIRYVLEGNHNNGNCFNPMILGDMVTYFIYENSISTQRILQLFSQNLNKFNIGYSFHFRAGVYETNDYAEGRNKLYKGYMPQLLECLSKKSSSMVSRYGVFKDYSEQNR